jgi:beta-phosphoglucomutase
MTILEAAGPRSEQMQTLVAAIFDVDGVLLASPHERAWREALEGFADPGGFTTAMYEAQSPSGDFINDCVASVT